MPGCGRRAPVLQQAGQGAGWAGAGAGCEARPGGGRAGACGKGGSDWAYAKLLRCAKEPTIRAGSGVGEQLGGTVPKSQKRRLQPSQHHGRGGRGGGNSGVIFKRSCSTTPKTASCNYEGRVGRGEARLRGGAAGRSGWRLARRRTRRNKLQDGHCEAFVSQKGLATRTCGCKVRKQGCLHPCLTVADMHPKLP